MPRDWRRSPSRVRRVERWERKHPHHTTARYTSPDLHRAADLCITYGKTHLSSDYQFVAILDLGLGPICSMTLTGPRSSVCSGSEDTAPCLIKLRVLPDGSVERAN